MTKHPLPSVSPLTPLSRVGRYLVVALPLFALASAAQTGCSGSAVGSGSSDITSSSGSSGASGTPGGSSGSSGSTECPYGYSSYYGECDDRGGYGP